MSSSTPAPVDAVTRPLRPCPLCGSEATERERTVVDHHSLESFEVHRCPSCRLWFLADAPASADLGRYYETEMGAGMHQRPGSLFRNMRAIRIRRDLKPLLAQLDPGAVVLDFGTGDGSVAEELASQGYAAAAVDLFDPADWSLTGVPYHQYSPDRGVGRDDMLVNGAAPAGMVVRHVLEHVLDPVGVLREAHAAGVKAIMVTVPNVDSRLRKPLGSAWVHWDPPRHLTYFSPETLRAAAEAAGYRVEHFATYGIDELVTSLYRVVGLRAARSTGWRRSVLRRIELLLQPKGLLAGLSAAASSPFSNCVCHAVLVAG